MSLEAMIWASIGALPALAVALVAARLNQVHPAVKTWLLRIAIVKAPITLLTGFFVAAAPASFNATAPEPLLAWFVYGVWFCGFILVLAHGFQAYRAAWRLEHRSRKVFEPQLSRELRINAYRVTGLTEPCLVGFLKPRLLIPEGAPIGEIALRHEMAHLRHGDAFFQGATWLAMALFWFVPGLGFALKEHSLAQEMWADADARKYLGVAPGVQAGDLLRASSVLVESRAAVLGYGGAAETVRRRIEAIYQKRFSPAAMAVCALAILAAAVPLKAEPSTNPTSTRAPISPIAAPVNL